VNPVGGFGRGFRTFDERCRQDNGRCVNRRALAALAELREPFFLYLHYLEPHQPYRPPADAPLRFAARGARWPRWVRRGDPWPIVSRLYRVPGPTFTAEDVSHLTDLYDDEVLFFDQRLAELLAALDGTGRLDDTLVAVVSDHGEELLDHGHWGHCRSHAWENVLATPLVLAGPGIPPTGERRAPVTNLDLVPTLVDYLGLPWQGEGFAGRSLRPAIERDRPLHRYRFALQGSVRVIDDGAHKLRLDLATGEAQLFDRRADPGERRDLAPTLPRLAASLRHALERWIDVEEGPGARSRADSVQRARESEAQLRAVGYL
jgi:arylsulfatase A-like enzyme